MSDDEPVQANQFTFFRSYHESTEELDDGERLLFYDSLFDFAFNGVVPEFDNRYLSMAWKLIAPSVEKSIKQSITNAENRRKREKPNGGNDRPDEENDRKNDRKNENGNRQNDRSPRNRNRSRNRKGVGGEVDGDTPLEGYPQSTPPKYGPLKCRMDGCDGSLLFDAKPGKFRCNKCRSTFTKEELGI